MANRDETIKRLCVLVSKVGNEVYKSTVSHDCFCGENRLIPVVDDVILNWLDLWTDAVIAARTGPEAPPALTDAEMEMVTASPSMGFWMTNPEAFRKMAARLVWLEQDRIMQMEEIAHRKQTSADLWDLVGRMN